MSTGVEKQKKQKKQKTNKKPTWSSIVEKTINDKPTEEVNNTEDPKTDKINTKADVLKIINNVGVELQEQPKETQIEFDNYYNDREQHEELCEEDIHHTNYTTQHEEEDYFDHYYDEDTEDNYNYYKDSVSYSPIINNYDIDLYTRTSSSSDLNS